MDKVYGAEFTVYSISDEYNDSELLVFSRDGDTVSLSFLRGDTVDFLTAEELQELIDALIEKKALLE